jgi:hypothetical protein
MKAWIEVTNPKADWVALAQEACRLAGAGAGAKKAKKAARAPKKAAKATKAGSARSAGKAGAKKRAGVKSAKGR